MIKIRFAYLLCFCLTTCFLTSCGGEEEDDEMNETENEMLGEFNFELGNKIYFRAFSGDGFWDNTPTMSYLEDTLVLEITDVTGDLINFDQYFTANSNSQTDPDGAFFGRTELDGFELSVTSDSLIIINDNPSVGHITWFSLDLEKINTNPMVVESWTFENPNTIHETHGHVLDLNLLGYDYNHLNVFWNYIGIAADGPGYHFLYSKDEFFVRFAMMNPWVGNGFGFDRINN